MLIWCCVRCFFGDMQGVNLDVVQGVNLGVTQGVNLGVKQGAK